MGWGDAGGVDDVDIVFTNRFGDTNDAFARFVACDGGFAERLTEATGDEGSELRVRCARKDFDTACLGRHFVQCYVEASVVVSKGCWWW